MTMKTGNMAARDALAEILGTVGLSYRVSDDGSLFVTTAARLAEESGKKGKVIEGPPVKLTLAPALKPADPSYREATRDFPRPPPGRPGDAQGGGRDDPRPVRRVHLRAHGPDRPGPPVPARGSRRPCRSTSSPRRGNSHGPS